LYFYKKDRIFYGDGQEGKFEGYYLNTKTGEEGTFKMSVAG